MKITRDGKEIELTAEELEEAHAEFVTNFMRMTLETDFGVSPEDSQPSFSAASVVTVIVNVSSSFSGIFR